MPTASSTPLLWRTTIWLLPLVALGAAVLGSMFGHDMALGLALGALVGLVNLWLLARATTTMVSNAAQYRPRPSQKWVLPTVLLLKWPLVLLVLMGILWYLPARPEGVALGVLFSLAAASIAALKGSSNIDSNHPNVDSK